MKIIKKKKTLIPNKNKELKYIRHSKYAKNYLNNLYNSFLNLVTLPMF